MKTTWKFVDVLTLYELLGIKSIGIVGDGGGGNEHFFTNMVEKKMVHDNCPSEESVSFVCVVHIH